MVSIGLSYADSNISIHVMVFREWRLLWYPCSRHRTLYESMQVNAFSVPDHILSAQVASDEIPQRMSVVISVLDALLPAYLDRDALCQYIVDACVVVDQNDQQEVRIPTSKWLASGSYELASLESSSVFVPTSLPQGKSLIDIRWVYALKFKNGKIARFKARFEQIAVIDFDQTYSVHLTRCTHG